MRCVVVSDATNSFKFDKFYRMDHNSKKLQRNGFLVDLIISDRLNI